MFVRNVPRNITSASITASIGGGSIAFDKNFPILPNLNNLMLNASSCNGVLNISGVICSSILLYRALEHK